MCLWVSVHFSPWLTQHSPETLAFLVTLFFFHFFSLKVHKHFPVVWSQHGQSDEIQYISNTNSGVRLSRGLTVQAVCEEWEQIHFYKVLKNKTQSRICSDSRGPGSATNTRCLQQLCPSTPPGLSNKKNPSKLCSLCQFVLLIQMNICIISLLTDFE